MSEIVEHGAVHEAVDAAEEPNCVAEGWVRGTTETPRAMTCRYVGLVRETRLLGLR